MTSLLPQPSTSPDLTAAAPEPGSDAPVAPPRNRRSLRTSELFAELADTQDEAERTRILEEVLLLNIPVAESIASRYRGRGVGDDDLEGVARLALVKAVRRYDTDSGHDFLSFAVPTIRGEIKRYFRDSGWMIRPPRRIQEIQAGIAAVESELGARLGTSPRPSELAAALEVDLSDVEEALAARGCFVPASLDRPVGETGEMPLADLLGDVDPAQGAAEARAVLGPLVSRLSERDRRVIELRFFSGLTQREIADDIGVTQMQVSRLLSRILRDLRRGLERAPADTLVDAR
ncbi:sigma-70 family RNA polymerase sigma factor [Nocardioides aurantiacus]|uniref:RNA polymerase sigma-B factor n=1 Tax=Nocardioides aurantiacus TaxID=86796 RepID=A0A3N2CZQ4_9ACTN|nr:sigma-70 family RNA polymerase sigma factor [Nocardioides aurantiacus]ROR93025.1 RNA polymerase sigma-B factor [Nocardioides aurantiacus]